MTMRYSWRACRADLLAGLTVAAVAVPQAMAYALIAGIEPVYGLYTAIVMTALASVFGSSKHLINGPTNAISLVVFAAVDTVTHPDRMQLVALLAVLTGLIQILIAVLKLGDLTRYVSESVILGFMAGASVLVALSQVHGLLGLKPQGGSHDHFLHRLWLTLRDGGPIDPRAVVIGLTTILLVYLLHLSGRWLRVRLPELLLTLILVSFGAWLFDPAQADGVGRLSVPRELPKLSIPAVTHDRVRSLWAGSLAIALLGLVEALSIAKALAARSREPFDYNRQCLAEGIANLGGGLFQCMPGSGSLTRSAINYHAGSTTRMSGIFSALAVALTVLMFAPLAQHIPQPALAGVILWTAWRIVDRPRFLFCLRATRFDAMLTLATAASAVLLSIEFSILIGVFLSFLFFVPRASRLRAAELTAARDRVVRERAPDDPACDRLIILSIEGQLFFGAAAELEAIFADVKARAKAGVRVIVLRLKRAHNSDMVCLEHLQHFLRDMQAAGVVVLLCGVREELLEAMARLGFAEWLPDDRVFPEGSPGNGETMSSTLLAVKRAYELLGDDRCANCPRRSDGAAEKGWYYMI